MKHASATAYSAQSIEFPAVEVREKLQSALSVLDNLIPAQPTHERAPVTAQEIRAVLKVRRSRAQFFAPELFADPAWDLLLQLYEAELSQQRVTITNLCDGAGVPATTALRWISALEKRRLLTRAKDPLDGRRVFVRLSSEARDAMDGYFSANSALSVL
jgi:DNA-binding MarR family transcriptional regulator